MEKINFFLKRLMDIFGSIFGMVLLFPLFVFVSVLIKLDSRGSVFFKQCRIGKNGVDFKIWKFRTMINGAENTGTGVFTSGSDYRITRFGKMLRRTSLDELPQLINILKGDMSFVGPRPPVTYHPYKFKEYPEIYRRRFLMKPGITGYAQVLGRNTLTWEERFTLDIKYIDNFSFLFDIKLLFQTVFIFANKKQIFDTENIRERNEKDVKR